MVDFRSLDGKSRQPTYAERARMEELRAAGVEDVYCEPWSAPDGFWLNLLQASTWLLATPGSHALLEWARETTRFRDEQRYNSNEKQPAKRAADSSPALQRWESDRPNGPVPEGRLKQQVRSVVPPGLAVACLDSQR